MLAPEDRTLISASIRPDPGFRLDHAFITTFTMELAAMLAVPVALSFQEWEEESQGDERTLAPVATLDAVRRHAANLTVVAETGRIAVPRKPQILLPLLEDAIYTVTKPGGTFHPKVWVLRYVPVDEGQGGVRYRVICSSRNLTFSRAWDGAVVLDGEISEDGVAGQGDELASFVEGVAGMIDAGQTKLGGSRAEKIRQIAEECRQVRFDLPDGVGNFSMHAIGFGKGFDLQPAAEDNRRLTISPFLGESVVEGLAGKESTLVSRQEELDALSIDPTKSYGAVYVLSDLADAESEEGEPIGDDLAGLHAKVFVEDRGWSSRIVLGSANASAKAFENNVEFVVALECRMKRSGVKAILGDSKTGMMKVLNPYVRAERREEDPAKKEAERAVEQAVRSLASAEFELGIDAPAGGGGGVYDLKLSLVGPKLVLPEVVVVECRPVTLDRDRLMAFSLSTEWSATWPSVPTSRVTSLIAFDVSAGQGSNRWSDAFVAKVRLANSLPPDRDGAITRQLINSRERLLSYLAFLLSDPNGESGGTYGPEPPLGPKRPPPDAVASPPEFPLLEKLVQAVDHDPESLDRVAGIIEELKKTEEGCELLPDGFEEIWEPVYEARLALKGKHP